MWGDAVYTGTSDRRHGLDIRGHDGILTVGADLSVTKDFVAGASLSGEFSRVDEFGGVTRVDSIGIGISPYIGFRILPAWTINASIGFTWIENDDRIDTLNADYSSWRYSASVTATGEYAIGQSGFVVRPKLFVYYARTESEAFDTRGTVNGVPTSLHTGSDHFAFGETNVSLEVNRTFRMQSGLVIMPYVEMGVSYDFERPNDGKIMTADLTLVDDSPWSGEVRAGVRALISALTFVELKGAYLSIGHSGLDIWEVGVFLSHGF